MNQPIFSSRAGRSRSRVVPTRVAITIVFLTWLRLSLAATVWAAPDSPNAAGPNLLLIIADDHGGQTLGIAGDPHHATPNLDELARQGVWFERAYCNSPLCTPSRQSLITGKLPHAVGVTQLQTRLPEGALTMGDWLS